MLSGTLIPLAGDHNVCDIRVTKVSQSRRTIGLPGKKCTYFCRVQRTGVYIYHRPRCARHPLCGSRLYRFKEKVTDGTSGEDEPSDKVCEAADAPESFKSGAWKHFVFPAWQVADRQTQHAQKVPHYNYRTPTALFQVVVFFSYLVLFLMP